MLLDKKQLLYEPFLVLDRVLMLALCSVCGQHSSFIILHTQKLFVSINFHFPCKNGKLICKSCNSSEYSISTLRKHPISSFSL